MTYLPFQSTRHARHEYVNNCILALFLECEESMIQSRGCFLFSPKRQLRSTKRFSLHFILACQSGFVLYVVFSFRYVM